LLLKTEKFLNSARIKSETLMLRRGLSFYAELGISVPQERVRNWPRSFFVKNCKTRQQSVLL